MSRFYFFLIIPFLLNAPGAEAKVKPAAGDIVLTKTLRPESNTVIDCDGGKISAAKPYKLYGAPWRKNPPSKPEYLIYLKDVHNVVIENCDISGGNFAIFIVGGGGHKIINNHAITGRSAITMVSSSDNLIEGNTIRYGDWGVLARGNSDRNSLNDNTIQLSEAFEGGAAVGSYWSPGDAVINLIVEGELTQVLNDVDTLEDFEVKNNIIEIARGPGIEDDGFFGVAFNGRTERGSAEGNTINGGNNALTSWGYEEYLPLILPGWCSEDVNRRCGEDLDCSLPGFDQKSKGQCEGAEFLFGETTGVLDTQFIHNKISDAYLCMSSYQAPTNLFENNDARNCTIGIQIGDLMLETGKVRGNIVHGSSIAFSISNTFGDRAKADISYNDFTNYETGVVAEQFLCDFTEDPLECNSSLDPNGYQLDTLISHNHWGANCEPPNLPPNIDASESYALPVAELYRQQGPGEDLGAFCN